MVRATATVPISPRFPRGRAELRRAVRGDLAAAQAALDELRNELQRHVSGANERLTLGAYAKRWLERRSAEGLAESTLAKYITDLELHILPVLGDMQLRGLRPSHVADWLAEDGGSACNRRNRLALVRQLARDSLAEELCDVDWVARVRAPEAEDSYTDDEPNLLTPEQARAVLAAIPERWRLLVRVLVLTGMRWGEVTGLLWEDVDLVKGLVTIRRGNWKGRETRAKNKRARRRVPLVGELVDDLRAHRAQQPPGTALVFPTAKGTRHRGTPLRRVLDTACKAAGVPRVTTHGLRRTWNNEARQVADGMVVRAIIGHGDERMTEHYSRVHITEAQRAADAVAERLRGESQEP